MGGLSEHDAREFLTRCDVGSGPLQDAILGACVDAFLVGDRAYHPYSLGLATDAVRAERRRTRGRDPDPESFRLRPDDHDALAQRFLKSLGNGPMEDWVRRLSLTPAFDERAALESYGGEGAPRAWKDLREFSFASEPEPGWWTLHARMTASLRHATAKDPDESRAWHTAWRDAWAARTQEPDDRFAYHEWTHAWHLDPVAAQAEWNRRVEELRRRALTLRHYAMLDWWTPVLSEPLPTGRRASIENDLAIELTEARVGDRRRNLERAISFYRAVLRVHTEEAAPLEWAMTQNNIALTLLAWPTDDRAAKLEEAEAVLTSTLRVCTEEAAPFDWADAQAALADVYGEKGGTEARLDALQKAERGYRAVGLIERAEACRRTIAEIESSEPD